MTFVCVVLAGGRGQRFGPGKVLATVGGRRLIDRALDACGTHPTVVVASEAVAAELAARLQRIVVVNNEPERGMNHSLQLALSYVPADAAVIVLLADMPFVDREIVERLERAFAPGDDVAFPIAGERPAHPVIFGPRARALLLELPNGDALRTVRDAPQLRRRTLVLANAELARDVDTHEDLAAADRCAPLG